MWRSAGVTLMLLGGAGFAAAQPGATAWNVLRQGAFQSQNPEHRKEAVAAIASIGPQKDVITTLAYVLKHDTDSIVRQTAAAGMGQLKTADAVPALREALDDPSGEVAFTAAKALWDIGDPTGKTVFNEILTGERKNSANFVGGAMRDAKRTMHDPKKLAYMGVKEASGALLGPFSMGITVAHDAMKDSGAPGRALAAEYMSKDCDARAVQLLGWSLDNDSSWLVKAASARGLAKCGDKAAVPQLEKYLSDSHEPLKYQAAAAIVRLTGAPEPSKELSAANTAQ